MKKTFPIIVAFVLICGCKKEAVHTGSPDIDISIVSTQGITSYKIDENNHVLSLAEKFHDIDEITEFDITAQERDSIHKLMGILAALQAPEIQEGIAGDDFVLIVNAPGIHLKRHAKSQTGSAQTRHFASLLEQLSHSSKHKEIFGSRNGLVYPPPSPPPAPDFTIEEIKFVKRPPSK